MKTKETQIKNLKKGAKVMFYGHQFEITSEPYLLWDKETLVKFNMGKELEQYNGDVYGAKCKILKECGDYILDSFEKFQGNDLYTCTEII